MTSFTVSYRQSRCIVVTPKGTSFRFYRIPYQLLESNKHGEKPDSDFVVYLLRGKDAEGSDCLYVGTSTNGIDSRPTSHGDKDVLWEDCIVFTSFDSTFLNDSKIRYIEDRLRRLIDGAGRFVNKTRSTTGKAANEDEKEECDRALPYILDVYDMMGTDLHPKSASGLGAFLMDETSQPERREAPISDYSRLKLPVEMEEWLKVAESSTKDLDPAIVANVTSTYVSFKYPGVSKTVAYCYPSKRDRRIRVLFQGAPEWYDDPKVTRRPDNMHNGDCKALFYISCSGDLKYYRLFAEIAVQRLGRRRFRR
ncbi:MAG: hypothetical protein IKQ60_01135 [Candidatus Methanomethylophilaceae archaeon]|nr:hypothetical protein [Candidatus Methanomethylophilaceae archaeon]